MSSATKTFPFLRKDQKYRCLIFLGINCFEMAKAIRGVRQNCCNQRVTSKAIKRIKGRLDGIQPSHVTKQLLTISNLSKPTVLLNFHPNTDQTGFRRKLWQKFCKNNRPSFTSCFEKLDGVDIASLPAIYKRNLQYPFWLSPRGNGIDCHRTWEALYLDTIPIVWSSTLDSLFANLPILVIKDWKEINENFLKTKFHEIALKKVQQPPVYRYETLRISYWQQLILAKSRYLLDNTALHRNRCWRGRTVQRR